MELIITHRARLVEKYGKLGWETIQSTLDDYLDTLNSVGIDANLFLLDDIFTSKTPMDPKKIKNAIQTLQSKYSSQYLLFLGGHDVIPFYSRPDGTSDRPLDRYVLSDTYYVDFEESEFEHWPEMAVGRLPSDSTSDLLVNQLKSAAAMHRAGGIPLSDNHRGFSSELWKTASEQTYSRLDKSRQTLKLCPPLGSKVNPLTGVTEAISAAHLPSDSILFFNVHGHRNKPIWWGEQRILGFPKLRTPELINQALLDQAVLTNSVILSEACHGAAIHGRTSHDSLALCALGRGALAFFSCTAKCYTISQYGGKPFAMGGIDVLFESLIYYLVVQRNRFGSALSEVKQRHSIFRNSYDEKNILSLVLLGDPMLRFR